MEIKLAKKSGVPKAEVLAHQTIQKEFSGSPFSKLWRGYAAFALARGGRGSGDDDLDLVLITHTGIALIELKNWHGKLLESDGQKWYLDGEDRGHSPVQVVRRKVPKLVSVMTQKLGKDLTPFISSYVVLHGSIGELRLPEEEQRSVIGMTEFLTFRFDSSYRQYMGGRHHFNPLDHLAKYDTFFLGSAFRPKVYYVEGFRPEANPIFEHPSKLYAEYRAAAKDDPTALALLRQWDFDKLGLKLIGETDRAFIGLREQKVFQYVADRNEDLSLGLLRPIAWKGSKDVTIDHAELFSLPGRVTRMAEFVHSTLPKLESEDRLLLAKAVISRFAELHDIRIAHRDIGEHSLWLDRPSRVIMSGFAAAYYPDPDLKTVGTLRERVQVEQSRLPEDAAPNAQATPYRRDVFMLGAVAHMILFGVRPPRSDGIHHWREPADDPFGGCLNDFFAHALNPDPAARFENARVMLEAFNAATGTDERSLIDLAAFDAFKAQTKERDYDETERLSEDEDHSFFVSGTGAETKVVKVWYGVEPDLRRPDLSLRLLSFLGRARTLKGCELRGVPRILDFGLSRRSLMLVMTWAEGSTLPIWLQSNPGTAERLAVATSLVATLQRLHAIDLAHGDVHPGNIVVMPSGEPLLIDLLDFRRNAADVYTTAYLPENYMSLTAFERDRYSAAAVLVDVLQTQREAPLQGELPYPRVYEELAHLLSSETLSTLQPLERALMAAVKPDDDPLQIFTVTIKNLAYEGVPAGELRSDNGIFHVDVRPDRQSSQALRIWVTGIGRQVSFVWNLAQERAESVRASSIAQSQLLRSQMMRDAGIRMQLVLRDGPVADVDDLARYLIGHKLLARKLAGPAPAPDGKREASVPEQVGSGEGTSNQDKAGLDPTEGMPARELWKALIDVEEEAFTTVTIAGPHRKSPLRSSQVLIPFHADGNAFEFDAADKVDIESVLHDGTWRVCGELDLRETSFGDFPELAVDHLYMKANLRIGSKLRLVSRAEKGSYSRRRAAVERILDDKAVVPNLVEYFDKVSAVPLIPTSYSPPPAAELEQYSEGNKKLNASQKEAFRRVLGHGPISLLQGPPGTGKTWFIAALLHHLMAHERVRRILLVSQAHEAVNNALEKAQELCRSKGLAFDAVRIGPESAVSEDIRHLHSASIEQAYRDRFKAELAARVIHLAASLGLPQAFAQDMLALHQQLGMLYQRLLHLQRRGGYEDEKTLASLDARARAVSETFFDIAADVYGITEVADPILVLTQLEAAIVERHEVRSVDAVERLRGLVRLSEDWIDTLGSPDANFAEFLAKSRTVVAGTLVGIGSRGAGITQNLFDWVIIDEAGRASSSELAVAMQAGHRVLLVGDHKQLPPMFSHQVRDAVVQQFGCGDDAAIFQSDFERIFGSDYGRQVGVTLLSQYRMAPNIGELVSTCFYEDRLETGRGAPPEYYEHLPPHLGQQVTWVDMSTLGSRGHHQQSEDESDTWNRAEAKVVMQILRQIVEADEFMDRLLPDLKSQEPAIGIICMYDKQREIIDQMKSEAAWLGDLRNLVKIDTVDSYQGKENRIVILSTVRNHPNGRVGFMWRSNRINVGVSRAMERLYVIGARKMWGGRNAGMPLGRVLSKIESMAAEGRAAVLGANQFMEA
ncbi:AAA domain-containing protein [Caballeronia sordidicola]|uniref:DNA helicase n=1 Tax=Caballeronia sordidicola TaxID=196367 RepID=A0A226WT97_CABSO|nr:AAA domain-containing protein [Caballeronia sordidicola]OXC74392.1 DNA helicase [Caballeronia sordidicola]